MNYASRTPRASKRLAKRHRGAQSFATVGRCQEIRGASAMSGAQQRPQRLRGEIAPGLEVGRKPRSPEGGRPVSGSDCCGRPTHRWSGVVRLAGIRHIPCHDYVPRVKRTTRMAKYHLYEELTYGSRGSKSAPARLLALTPLEYCAHRRTTSEDLPTHAYSPTCFPSVLRVSASWWS